ncbi:hypothetical protein OESDEN_10916 [Oesophagostomum dentatum]|uniref:Uncharacterized protein n=1 Tax=Oesophagostomum dentatum TaxID=61180 RepID=A0A0B1SVD6_OESDE|nr:hypothetical protein OESDEN_10916 [Oesophagostomum dentatum]
MGNQLYHLITGYGIARTLNRTHYFSIRHNCMPPVVEYLRQLTNIFPRLHSTFVISPYEAEEAIVEFSASCCDYVNPLRLSNRNEDYLLLNMTFGQHPKYFEDYLADVRSILEFSDETIAQGSELLKGWKM